MKVLAKHMRQGTVTLLLDASDDLWHLSQLIEEGDVVVGLTERKVTIGDKATEKTRVEKRTLRIRLLVKTVQWAEDTLRVGGIIDEAIEDIGKGSHHTLTLRLQDTLTLIKEEWPAFQEERLHDATKNQKKILLVLFDREDALFSLLAAHGHVVLSKLKGHVAKKAMKSQTSDFYQEIAEQIAAYESRYTLDTIILASPAFWNEYLLQALPAGLKAKAKQVTCSSADESSIPDILRRPELHRTLEDDKNAKESTLVHNLLAGIAQGKAAYGERAVHDAVAQGNLQAILVSESLLRERKERGLYGGMETLLRSAERVGGKVHVISTDEAKKKLDGLGGVACLLRWSVSSSP